jgi:hypothetical protein
MDAHGDWHHRVGLIAVFAGIADLKDRAEQRKEEA